MRSLFLADHAGPGASFHLPSSPPWELQRPAGRERAPIVRDWETVLVRRWIPM